MICLQASERLAGWRPKKVAVMAKLALRFFGVAALALSLAGCNVETSSRSPARASAPVPQATLALMSEKNTDRNAPILIRAYKKEAEIEVWKRDRKGDYVLLKSYPVCRWSGQLGPKRKEGDRQVPEGFYSVTAGQLNPNSSYWLAFNVGYPNPMERSMGRSGGDIMVHGICSSRGCFAMTDSQIEEIYAVMREAFNAGQKSVQFQSYPFKMTAENLAKFRHDPNMPFWKNLKEGSDHFEVTKREPKLNYCNQRYVFNAEGDARFDPTGACPTITVDPTIAEAVRDKQRNDEVQVARLVEKGTQAIKMTYADGGQHASFRNTAFAMAGNDAGSTALASPRQMAQLGDVSRPDALDQVHEIPVDERGQAIGAPRRVQQGSGPSIFALATPEPVTTAVVTKKPAETDKSATEKPAVVAVAKPSTIAPAPDDKTSGLSGGGLFSTSLNDLTGLFKPTPAKPSEPQATGFYDKLINVIKPDAGLSDSKPDLPAKVPLPPRRQAMAGSTSVQ
jgi:murein L,D-transpeptidase YafK